MLLVDNFFYDRGNDGNNQCRSGRYCLNKVKGPGRELFCEVLDTFLVKIYFFKSFRSDIRIININLFLNFFYNIIPHGKHFPVNEILRNDKNNGKKDSSHHHPAPQHYPIVDPKRAGDKPRIEHQQGKGVAESHKKVNLSKKSKSVIFLKQKIY